MTLIAAAMKAIEGYRSPRHAASVRTLRRRMHSAGVTAKPSEIDMVCHALVSLGAIGYTTNNGRGVCGYWKLTPTKGARP
jgi:hypothetical protein